MANSDEKQKISFEPAIEGVKRLKTAEQYTDLVVVCNGEEWNVHKLWLRAQSDFFQKACSGAFSEAKENKITLEDDDPKLIAALIHFFYNFDYEEHRIAQNNDDPLAFDVDMYIIADKYFVPTLKKLAASNFEQRAGDMWNKDEFFNSIARIYQNTSVSEDNLLRKAAGAVVKPHAKKLLNVLSHSEDFLKIIDKNAESGKDMLVAVTASANPIGTTMRCPYCRDTFTLAKRPKVATCPNNCMNKASIEWWLSQQVKD